MENVLFVFSGKGRSGKTTSKDLLKEIISENCPSEINLLEYSFADPIREISKKYFNWSGNKDISDKPDEGRTLLINIGMKFREIRPTVWLDFSFNSIKNNWIGDNTVFVLDDCRFRNEMEKLKTLPKCISIRLSRFNQLDLNDQSEKDLDDTVFDYYIENNGTKEELKEKINKIFSGIRNNNV